VIAIWFRKSIEALRQWIAGVIVDKQQVVVDILLIVDF
jgi:hypothetical protein